jgi:putative NADH-flavin reductase
MTNLTSTDPAVTNLTITDPATANLIIFGAGGRAGRAAVAEALARGHQVTAIVRDPAKYPELAASGAKVLAGDATDAEGIGELAHGHDAAISAVYDPATGPAEFFTAAARALVDGLGRAGVPRLVAVGIGTALEVAPGLPLHDSEGFPAEYRDFSVGHTGELAVFEASALDWLVLSPPPVVLGEAARTGVYRLGGTQVMAGVDAFSYADLAVALVDEAARPTRRREVVAVG